jgi:hypothetical protein
VRRKGVAERARAARLDRGTATIRRVSKIEQIELRTVSNLARDYCRSLNCTVASIGNTLMIVILR